MCKRRIIEFWVIGIKKFLADLLFFAKTHKKMLLIYFFLCALLIPLSWQQDVYDWYYFLGKFVVEGKNVYEPINVYAIVKRGDTGRFGYPPFFLLLFSLSYVISDISTLPFHIIYKLFPVIVNVLIAMQLEKITKSSQSVALYLFNPLTIVTVAVQGFLDVLVIYFIIKVFQDFGKKSSAAYLGLSSLSKQTAWPLVPFFLMLNLNLKWFVVLAAVFLGGLAPFVILNCQSLLNALLFGYINRLGVSPLSPFLVFDFLKKVELHPWIDIISVGLQLMSILVLSLFVKIRLKKSAQNKTKLMEYFMFYELVTFSFLYFLAPHFLSYLLFPIVILMATYSEFKYPYFCVTIAGYVFFIFDQGLRHNFFHYNVWAPHIYLGFAYFEPVSRIIGGIMSAIMYGSFLFTFFRIRRRGAQIE